MDDVKLGKEIEDRLLGSIQRYARENLEEPLGDLKARLLLDFCLREIGPAVYNQAIVDAQSHLQTQVAELDVACHRTEFTYWNKKK